MNISSLIVYLKDGADEAAVKAELVKFEGCEIVTSGEGKIVITIESEVLGSEFGSFRAIQNLEGVSDIGMVYSYQDLDDQIDKAEHNDIGEIVRKVDASNPEDIKYSGKINV